MASVTHAEASRWITFWPTGLALGGHEMAAFYTVLSRVILGTGR